MRLPDDYGDRVAAVNAFIRCPDCGSDRATLDVQSTDGGQSNFRGTCPECGTNTQWIYGDSEEDQ